MILSGFWIQSTSQTDSVKIDSCFTHEQIKAIELLVIDGGAYKSAYHAEVELRKQDSIGYNFVINAKDRIINDWKRALELEQAMPKTIVKQNADWYWYMAGGSAITAIIYLAYKLLIEK